MPADPAQVAAFRRFLKLESERLRMRHRLGMGGAEVAARRSAIVDKIVTQACNIDAAAAPGGAEPVWAVVALGGYGRGELAPFSDVDLLFLHGGASPALNVIVERVLRVLWDVGLTIGHSFRSPRECIAEARADLQSRTALGEARLISGNGALFQRLMQLLEALRQEQRSTDAFLESLGSETAERHLKHGNTVCVVEPHIKEGLGGLRDLHTVLWIAAARFGSRGLSGLRDLGRISERQHALARRAYDFLTRVRNEAHFACGRKADLLTHDLHPGIAQALGYRPLSGLLASELLMRDYYRRASELRRFCEGFQAEQRPPERRFGPFRIRRRSQRGLEVREGHLRLRSAPRAGIGTLLDAFETAQELGAPLDEEMKQTIRERSEIFDRRFRGSREAGRFLLRLLGRRGRVGPAVRALHDTGVLGRLIPEFARITFLIQHDQFHRYTIDEHTLKAIEALDAVAAGCEPGLERLGRALDETEDAAPLYLGMLLHDIGKGLGGGHVEKGGRRARRVLERLRVEPEIAETAVFLVLAHLEMSQVSQQRDLSEPSLIDAFAERVGSLGRLNLLLLLTYADHRAVGPGIWNEWKATLLFELYDRVRERLVVGQDGAEHRARASAEAAARLTAEFPHHQDEIERHFANLPERYLRTTDAERMTDHFRLVRRRDGPEPARLLWRENAGHWAELTIVADDRPGLFATLAGTLTANGIDILSVDLFTLADGTALDTFHVAEIAPVHRAPRPERQKKLDAALRAAVAGELDVERSLAAWRPKRRARPVGRAARAPVVRFDQSASALATVVEVRCPDQPGLAHTIARTLAGLGLDISFARVATAKALALDVFYVRDARGAKLDDAHTAQIEAALLEALGAPHRSK